MTEAETLLTAIVREEGYEDIQDWLMNASTYNQEEVILTAMKEYAFLKQT
ncbi:hypothetical protein [Nibribacter koreensis]|uniref:Uncharacterized protein n=1 Tax=Nibribacter koreensis TaxID=1084519 RepID=A0ABP8FBH5_9BACT